MTSLSAVTKISSLPQFNSNSVVVSSQMLKDLSAEPGDEVLITGGRTVAFVLAKNPLRNVLVGPHEVMLDETALTNLDVSSGVSVTIERIELPTATSVTVELPSRVVLLPEHASALLNNQRVATGDAVSFRSLPSNREVLEARNILTRQLASNWSVASMKVIGVSPSPARLTRETTYVVKTPTVEPSPLGALADKINARSLDALKAASVRGGVLVEERINRIRAEATTLARSVQAGEAPPPTRIGYDDLFGHEAARDDLSESIDLSLNHQDLLATLGSAGRFGVLLIGSAGVGKRTLVNIVAEHHRQTVSCLDAERLVSLEPNSAYAEFKAQLTSDIVHITHAESMFPTTPTSLSRLALASVKDLLDHGRIVVLSTSDVSSIHPDALKPDVITQTLTLAPPSAHDRLRLLEVLTRNSAKNADLDLPEVSQATNNFLVSDLVSLVSSAGSSAARRVKRTMGGSRITNEDFTAALTSIKTSQTRFLDIENIELDDVLGVDDIKQTLTESVLWPLQYSSTFSRLGVTPPRGLLMYGPPGCGKTYLVKALASTGRASMFSVKGAELLSKWVGESEAQIRDVFARARASAPSIIFIDEIDALAPPRGGDQNAVSDRVVASLLTELDGVESLKDVVVIGATNRPDMVDPALLRPGRLGRLVFVPPPDASARLDILKSSARGVPFDNVNWEDLSTRTEGFSAADCNALVQEAALTAMRANLNAMIVTSEHLNRALSVVRPSLDPRTVRRLELFASERV